MSEPNGQRPKEVAQTSIDPDADSLDAIERHAARRLRRLREEEADTVARLNEIHRQLGRERTVLMLNGIDPDQVEDNGKKDAPDATEPSTPGVKKC